ncbi:bifunctional UDP-2,4-diacetamido-2,4,6-trideoxy-beta-L-altropyranose hydrolase/GNAT family N-acetyltransferase [Sinomonas susongensis]|uniref:bifunctional UDP-2,4-diacetamido-2,4,6-trideoxy-beta-L-altropyranose hydrolase/GNAT family N-acetyltransferase n=1 Tax=Sinomonas susongensis TaxID=1324851 RepID=UPI0011089771|nr:bifunctional UDP-2,4-diacetamido-2,4,6-trideoxy-beta-L-altropyranose hydrolase/GNAT family N-acetyltransferase [Sinomonas susongensis]
MRVLLRCDSAKTQGLGHVVRCVAVGEAAREAGWDVIAAGDVESPLGRRLLGGVAGRLFPRPPDAEALARLARQEGVDVVHLDTYDDEGDVRARLAEAGVLLSSVEDGSFGRRPADLAIDPSAGAESGCRPEDGTLRLARGAGFIPVRALVRELRSAPRRPPEGFGAAGERPAVVTVLGGTDARDATAAVVRLWAETGVPSHCTAVVPGGRAVEVGGLPDGLTLEVVEQSGELPRLFAGADLVISGAGTTIWELAALGVPMALIQLVENQRQNYAFAVGRGMAAGLGAFGEDPDAAARTLRQVLSDPGLRARLAAAARSIVDGEGAARIVGLWQEVRASREGVAVRSATPSDAAQLFHWRNDPSVRSVSRSTGELQWDGHLAWLARSLERTDVVLLMAEADGAAAGTVRFDALGVHDWEVSITLAPSARGRGLARAVLRAAEERFLRDHPEATTLHAVMRASNEPSHRLFLGAGYASAPEAPEGTDDGAWHRLVKDAPERPQRNEG